MCAYPLAGRIYQFTTKNDLSNFFRAVAAACFPEAKEVVFNGNGGKSLGWDEFRAALMEEPRLSDKLYAQDDLLGWRVSELWQGINTLTRQPYEIFNLNATTTDFVMLSELHNKLTEIKNSMQVEQILENEGIVRPVIEPPADLICVSNIASQTASMSFTMYDTSPKDQFGKPPRYKPWQREVTWEINSSELAEKPAIKKILEGYSPP